MLLWGQAVIAGYPELPRFREYHQRTMADAGEMPMDHYRSFTGGAILALTDIAYATHVWLQVIPGTERSEQDSLAAELGSLPPLTTRATRYIQHALDCRDDTAFLAGFQDIFERDHDHAAMFEATVAMGYRVLTRHNVTGESCDAYLVLGQVLSII